MAVNSQESDRAMKTHTVGNCIQARIRVRVSLVPI